MKEQYKHIDQFVIEQNDATRHLATYQRLDSFAKP